MDYNHLESAFLVSGIVILILGMVFSSDGFTPGSFGYDTLAAITSIIILTSSASFGLLLTFEVYRSLKMTSLDLYAREVEVVAQENAVALRLAQRSASTSGGTGIGKRVGVIMSRRESVVALLRRRSSVTSAASASTTLWEPAVRAEPP